MKELNSQWLERLPIPDHSPQSLKDYIARHLNPWSPRRRWNTQRAALNTWMYLGRQWIEPVGELVPGAGTFHFRELFRDSKGTFPRPVTNIIGAAVDNEVARLTRKELVPDTRAGRSEPDWIEAAKLAREILKWELGKVLWGDKREQIAMNLTLEGTAIARSYWHENQYDVVFNAALDAVQCPSCRAIFSSPVVPRSFATLAMPVQNEPREMMHKDSLAPFQEEGEASAMHPDGIERVRMQHCPMCTDPQRLEPYMVSEEEAKTGTDLFNRSLGVATNKGQPNIQVLQTHEYYPQNTGIGIEPHECQIHHQMTVETLENVASRFPDIADKIFPEEPSTLLRLNPLFSEPVFGQLAGAGQSDDYSSSIETYDRHVRVREVVVDPMPGIKGLEDGGWIVQVNDQILAQPLMVSVDSQDGPRKVARVKYAFARFKRVPGYFYGRTFVDDLVPINRRLNEIDAQWVDLRERGKPTIFAPPDTEFRTKAESQGSMVVVYVDGPDPTWNPKDGMFPGMPLSGQEYSQERANCFTDAQMVGSAQDIEMGRGSGGVKTTSGLMLLSEEAAQKRGPRERGLAGMYETLWQQHLDMTWALQRNKGEIEVLAAESVYQLKSYRGEDLLGSIRVKLDARAGYDNTLYNKEAAGEAMQLGLVNVGDPVVKEKLMEIMRLPSDLNEDQNNQVKRAESAWSEFRKDRKIVVYDESLFAPDIWFGVLSKRWMQDETAMLTESVGFPQILERLVGWQQVMQTMDLQDQQQRMLYEAFPPEQWPQIYEQTAAVDKAAWTATAEAMQSAGQPAPQEPATQPPPVDGFLPKSLPRRIYTVWKRMLPALQAVEALTKAAAEADIETPGLEDAKTVDLLLQMRAVIEAAKMLAEQRMQAAAAPTPVPVQPGA